MVWSYFSALVAFKLKITDRNLDSLEDCAILSEIMMAFGESAYEINWLFQQDNASMHTSSLTSEFFMDMLANTLE